jgi:TetR/AcrR family transcriptional repressor of mexJK operon
MDNKQRARHRSGARSQSATRPRRGPGRQTPAQTEQRNIELLDKALDLFLEHGFERTTIDGIAAAVGMAKRTVYLRYGNKTKLFKTALQRAIEEWIVPVAKLRSAEGDDDEGTLLRIGQMLLENILSPAGVRLLRITNAESGRMPEIGQFTYTQGTAPTIAYLTDFIRRRIRPGGIEVADPQQAAVAFLYLVVGGPASLTAWGIAIKQAEIDIHTRYCIRLFLHGLLDPSMADATPQIEGTRRLSRRKSVGAPRSAARSQPFDKQRTLEEENRRLKLLLAESMLTVAGPRNAAKTR